jgi:hypothetical protein
LQRCSAFQWSRGSTLASSPSSLYSLAPVLGFSFGVSYSFGRLTPLTAKTQIYYCITAALFLVREILLASTTSYLMWNTHTHTHTDWVGLVWVRLHWVRLGCTGLG